MHYSQHFCDFSLAEKWTAVIDPYATLLAAQGTMPAQVVRSLLDNLLRIAPHVQEHILTPALMHREKLNWDGGPVKRATTATSPPVAPRYVCRAKTPQRGIWWGLYRGRCETGRRDQDFGGGRHEGPRG